MTRKPSGEVAVLIPVKAFTEAKARLAPALGERERELLVKEMAAGVLRAAWPLAVAVVCDDVAVADWAVSHGASVVWTPSCKLNDAVAIGLGELAGRGARRIIVAHADLPLATQLSPVAEFDGVTLVPDRFHNGTNVACVPAAGGFRFSYGHGSFSRHLSEARRVGLPLRVMHEPLLAWDVDVPGDLVPR